MTVQKRNTLMSININVFKFAIADVFFLLFMVDVFVTSSCGARIWFFFYQTDATVK